MDVNQSIPDYWEEKLEKQCQETQQELGRVEAELELHLETGALLLYRSVSELLTDVERDINICSLLLKSGELALQEEYAEKGMKAIKTREQLARDDMTKAKIIMEDWKRSRDKLRNHKQFIEYYLEGDY